MIKSIEQLKATLQQELKMYEEVLEMAKQKTDYVKKGDLKGLEKTIEKEQQYIRTMGTFEKIRRSIFVNIGDELEIRQPESISELLLHLEEEEVSFIDGLRNQLLKVIEKLAEVNSFNEELIHRSLEYVNFNIQLMTSNPEEGNNYGAKDLGKRKSISNLLDMKV